MALNVADGTITLTTGAVGTTFTVSGLPFQPKAVFLFWSGRATNGSGEADHKFGSGFFTATNSRRVYTSQSQHGEGTTDAYCGFFNDCVVCTLSAGGSVDGKADVDAITSDGFRLIIDDQFSAGLQVGWIAYGGSDITDVAIIDIPEPGSTGNQDYNVGIALNTGEDDKAVIFLGGTAGEGNVNEVPQIYSGFTFGVAAGNTPSGAVLTGSSEPGRDTSVSSVYCRAGECAAYTSDIQVYSRATLTAWLSTGFRLNWAEVGGFGLKYSALVIKGGRWFVGNATTSTGTTNQFESTPYTPKALLIGSAMQAASTSDIAGTPDRRVVGCATSASSRRYAAMLDKHNVGISDIGIAYGEDAMYASLGTAATIAITGLMDLVSFDATPGFTYVMDDADPSAAFFFYLGCADASSAVEEDADITEGAEFGASFDAVVTAKAAFAAGIEAGISVSAKAAGKALFEAALAAADAQGSARATTALISESVSAAEVVAALSDATAALTAGAELGEDWAASAQVAAALAAAGEFGAEFTAAVRASEEALLTAQTEAAAVFTAAAQSLASVVSGASLAQVITGVAATTAQMLAGVQLSATFAALETNERAFSAGVSADSTFALVIAALGSITATVGAQALFDAASVTSAAFSAGATVSDAWTAEGGISQILPPPQRMLLVQPRNRTFLVQPPSRTYTVN